MNKIFSLILAIIAGLFATTVQRGAMVHNSAYAYKTILVKSMFEACVKDRVSSVITTPGMLLEIDSDGKYKPHATGSGSASPIFALEEEYVGESISTNSAVGDIVRGLYAQTGDEIFALLATGETAVIGSYLASNGDGTLLIYTPATTNKDVAIVGRALEALTASGSTRLLFEVI